MVGDNAGPEVEWLRQRSAWSVTNRRYCSSLNGRCEAHEQVFWSCEATALVLFWVGVRGLGVCWVAIVATIRRGW
jgi:hypothetical protein